MKYNILPLFTAAFFLSLGTANSQVVYLEDFNAGSGTRTLADFGLSGVDAGGTSITSSTGFNNGAVYAATGVEGSGYASIQNDWVWMDAPQLSSITQVRWLDQTAALGYRVGLEIGGTWYLSETVTTSVPGGFDPGDGAHPGVTITDFSSGFAAWSGAPANDTTAWDNTFTGTLGTAGALPAGTITRIGLMAEGGSHRADYFEVSGTVVPESSIALLCGISLLALLRRRR